MADDTTTSGAGQSSLGGGLDFRRQTVEELAGQVRRKELSARELVEHSLARIEALDGRLNSFCALDAERARQDAAELDRRIAAGEDPGPLAGIPLGVKDLEDAAGFVTTYGSALRAGDAPAALDSPLVARLRAAGCIVLGKTNTPEYGHKGITDNPLFGATANPWSLEHSSGGSSGGTASAVAAGLVPLGTGSDGGGSIRLPSSVCGLSGIKTSQGRVPLGGPTAPGSGVLSVKGPMTRTVRDAALALDACVGPHPTDIFSHPAPPAPWRPELGAPGDVRPPERVVWCPNLGFGTVDREVLDVCERAVSRLADAGTEVIPVDVVFRDDPLGPWLTLWVVARYKAQGHVIGTPDWERLSPSIRPQIELGAKVSGADHARALDAAHALNWELEAVLGEVAPILLCPTVAGRPPRLDAPEGRGLLNGEQTQAWVQFTPVFNLTRNPAGSVCAGLAGDGLPVGLQVVGRQLADLDVLRAMAALEDVIGFDRLPEVAATTGRGRREEESR
jgi:Asp-tRNA(Asn)/Glu-tRNA(Gln) amidotransferase A subunit family amidase